MKVLDLYITKVCNLNCDYCYVDVVRQADENFSSQDFMERVNLLDYDSIKFFGGEPLLKWKEIQEIILAVTKKKPDMYFGIISNGLLLDQKKVDFVKKFSHVEILLSLHDPSFKVLKRKVDLIRNLGDKTGLYIILEPGHFPKAISKFLYFFSRSIKHFTFAPEIYGDWSEQNLRELQSILSLVGKCAKKYQLIIGGISSTELKSMNYGCEKTVYDESGMFKPCNRFKSLGRVDKFNYKQAYEYFDKEIGYKSDPYRWFSVCPVGWYLDHIDGDLSKAANTYKKLNEVFLDFYRDLFNDSYNFLTPNIEEIRFNMTRQCNLRCEYCYVDFTDDHLDFLTGKNIVDYFLEQKSNTKTLSFFGGEPLLQFDTLKKLVKYSEKKSQEIGTTVSYRIATNFMLMTEDVRDLFIEYEFDIHVSLNGYESLNNKMRDSSTDLVLKNLKKYGNKVGKENFTILLAFSPFEVNTLSASIKYVYDLGFEKVNLEMVFGERYKWTKESVIKAVGEAKEAVNICDGLTLLNTHKKHISLDIDVTGKCAENSLKFYGAKIDGKYKRLFDTLITRTSTQQD